MAGRGAGGAVGVEEGEMRGCGVVSQLPRAPVIAWAALPALRAASLTPSTDARFLCATIPAFARRILRQERGVRSLHCSSATMAMSGEPVLLRVRGS